MTPRTATLIGLSAILMWSLLAVLTVATGRIPAFQLLALTFAIGALITSASWIGRPGAIRALRQPPLVWAVGVGGLFGYHALYFVALRLAPPAEAGLLNYLWPLLIVLLSSLLPGERLASHHIIGAVLGLAGTVKGLIFVNTVYGIGFTTLFFRNYYAAFPNELIRSARMDGAGFFGVLMRILLPNSAPIIVVTVIWQFTNIWNEFLFGASFSDFSSFPITVALNNLVNSSTGVKEYNVHFAGAFIAAIPTLVSGKYFVRGLMAGSVKG